MRRFEQKVFFILLERWVRRNHFKVETPSGCLCLLPNLEYDVVIKDSLAMRKWGTHGTK